MSQRAALLEAQIVQMVRKAGALLADPNAVRTVAAKSQTDYVTNVDTAVQNLLQDQLYALDPEVQFLGEEGSKDEIGRTMPD